jgi:hypothetical protein
VHAPYPLYPRKRTFEGCLSDVRYGPLEAADAVARSAVAGKLIVPIADQPDLWAETVKLRDQGEYRFCLNWVCAFSKL